LVDQKGTSSENAEKSNKLETIADAMKAMRMRES
jgi:hypothetical protein